MQLTLKDACDLADVESLRAQVIKLTEELEAANRGLECYRIQLAADCDQEKDYQSRIAKMEEVLGYDWNVLEATQESLREANRRITELEKKIDDLKIGVIHRERVIDSYREDYATLMRECDDLKIEIIHQECVNKSCREDYAAVQQSRDYWRKKYNQETEELKLRLMGLEADCNHWKANHDNRVLAARMLIERDDLPLERINAYKDYIALQSREKQLREALSDLVIRANRAGVNVRMAEDCLSAIDAVMKGERNEPEET
jgi:chromosome segregation ATPase